MGLSSDLISQFVKITNDTDKSKKETTSYGTAVDYGGTMYVRLDGSDLLTPMTNTVGVKDGDRVTITIKNHSAIVNGNISSPAASSSELKDLDDRVGNFITVTTEELNATSANIESLEADNVKINEKLIANEAYISALQTDNVTINNKLTAAEAAITKVQTDKLDAELADITFATIENLDATNVSIRNLASDYGNFKELTTDNFTANDAAIKKLQSDKADISELNAQTADIKILIAEKASIEDLSASNARIDTLVSTQITTEYLGANYADIDLANVTNSWIQNGIIKEGAIGEAAIHDGAITNVKIADASIEAAKIKSINADSITAGTLKTNRLIITDEDGNDSIVKAINTANGVAEANGMKLQAASIDVVDLSAFEATIAQFNIISNAIYSGKTSITDPTSGIYISTTGIGIGDGSLSGSNESPIQMYADGGMKLKGKNGSIDFNAVTGDLSIDASSLKVGSKTVASNDDVNNAVNAIEIGGRNYVLESAFDNYTPDGSNISKDKETLTFNTGDPKNYVTRIVSNDFLSSAQGKKLALSMDIKVNEEIVFGTTNPWIGFELTITYVDDSENNSRIDLLGGKRIPTEVADWKRYTSIATVKDAEIKSCTLSIVCRDFTGSISVKHPKVEISTKASDWTPAPEDINSDIIALNTRVTNAETSIEQNATEIALRATTQYVDDYISDVATTIGDLETSIQENSSAISLRATKTEVSTAANKALADSKTYTDAQIKVSADNITSTVSNTYQTKSDMSRYLTKTSADETYALLTSLNALSSNLDVYVESSTSMIQDINGWQYNWNKILRTDEADIANHQDYITFQNGDIILGESGSNLKVKIGNDAIQFKGDSETDVTPDPDATAWITGQMFNINAGEIHTSLKINNLQFVPRPNGNFSITIA